MSEEMVGVNKAWIAGYDEGYKKGKVKGFLEAVDRIIDQQLELIKLLEKLSQEKLGAL